MKSRDNTKNQHYVPQGYLKNFTFDNDKQHIYCFNKNSEKVFPINVRNVASENYFYELPKDLAEKYKKQMCKSDYNSNEKYFWMFEDAALPLIDKMISICIEGNEQELINFIYNNCSFENRAWLGIFFILQYYRTKKYRNKLYEQAYSLGRSIYNNSMNEQLKKDCHKISIMQQMVKFLDLNELNKELNLIGNYIWIIGENNSDIPFVTSDNPVVEFKTILEKDKNVNTWLIPLNSKYCLIILFDYFTGNLRYLAERPIKKLTLDCVIKFNTFQFQQSQMFIFSQEKSIKEFFSKRG